MDSSAPRISLAATRPLGAALHAALILLLVLAMPVLAGDPGNGNGNGNGNGHGNGNGPDRTEAPGPGGDPKPTPAPTVVEPTPGPTTVAPAPPEAPSETSPPAATPRPAQPVESPPVAAAAPAASVPRSRPASPAPASATSTPRPSATPPPALDQGAEEQSAGTAASPPSEPGAPTASARPAVEAGLIALDGKGESASGPGRDGVRLLLLALIALSAVTATAGGLVLVGRRRGVAREPAIVTTGPSAVAVAVPVSDPLLAALQGSTRLAPPDGTMVGAGGTTLGDGAPQWVRRLDPRIPVLPGRTPAEARRLERPMPLADALEP